VNELSLRVNGEKRRVAVDPRTTLLDLLREQLGLTGTKKGCDQGQCGACTVLVDGRRVTSCLTLALQQEGREVVTVEGLADGDALHPVQQAFVDARAFQCGYCTPGMIVAATALLKETPNPSDAQIRAGMNRNLCRCCSYSSILRAVRRAAAQEVK